MNIKENSRNTDRSKSKQFWFVFDPNYEGFSYFETRRLAESYANKIMRSKYLKDLCWEDGISQIIIGVRTHEVHMTNYKLDDDGIDYKCDYKLRKVANAAFTPSKNKQGD